MRNLAFRYFYYLVSAFFAISALPLLALPNRKPLSAWVRLYTQTMLFLMRMVAGVRVTVRGSDRLPSGPCVIAAKHQSWGDGFCLYSQLDDLAFVTGDHLERFPLLSGILRKLGAVVVNNCGGVAARARLLDDNLRAARDEGRRILIYPEGHLAPIGRKYRYKRGVYHMYAAYNRPVVPVATNLGLYWPQARWDLTPGEAIVEILDPIEPGLGKEAFMARLETAIETRSLELLGDARPADATPQTPALPDPRPQLAAGA
ncbi:MAG: 1-acyl-sn-glycerol-3-phosphate acyltransferase [Pseudomonadota bacterium]